MTKVHASLFSGFGAADLAATWMGWDNAFWCEIEEFPRAVLSYWFPKSKGYGNIKETDFTPWRGKINVLTGGFPCQPFSVAGKRKGADDNRYLWPHMLRAIREIRPDWVIGENVGGILTMVQPGEEVEVGNQTSLFEENNRKRVCVQEEYVVETICRDLEREGYSVQALLIPACAVGAPHRRDRIFFIAYGADARAKSLQRKGENEVCRSEIAPDSNPKRFSTFGVTSSINKEEWANENRRPVQSSCNVGRASRTDWWKEFPTQSPICRGNDGLPFNVDDLTIPFTRWRQESVKGYGNAIVPQVMYEIFKAIEEVEQLA